MLCLFMRAFVCFRFVLIELRHCVALFGSFTTHLSTQTLLFVISCTWSACKSWLFVWYYILCCPACQLVVGVVFRSSLTTTVIKSIIIVSKVMMMMMMILL